MELFYREEGVSNAQNLIILHGFLGSADNWLSLGRRFAQKYHVFLIDQRNHGRSFHSSAFDYDLLAQDLHDFMQAKNIETAHLIGHSMGGKVIINFAKKFPQKVQKMVVADMGIKANRLTQGKILEGLNAVPLHQLQSRQQAEQILSQYEKDYSTLQFLLKSLYRREDGVFAWRFNLPVLSEAIFGILEKMPIEQSISCPSLFIRGTKSDYILDEDKVELKEKFTNIFFDEIEAGHWLHAEKPEAFFEQVSKFLE